MALTLTGSELRLMNQAADILLSPFDHGTVDDWRQAANRVLKELLGAGSAGFLLPVSDGLALWSEEHDPSQLARYPDYPPPLVDGSTPVWTAVIERGPCTLAQVYGAAYDSYTNSPYNQEYAGANGAHHPLIAAVSLGGMDAYGMAALHFWKDEASHGCFGERDVEMLKLLFPAFRSGAETHRRWGAHQQELLSALDVLGESVLACTTAGVPVHATTRLSADVEADPDGGTIVAAMAALARRTGETLRGETVPAPSSEGEIATGYARYRVRASQCGAAVSGDTPLVLVSLERRSPVPRADEELRATYGLTRAEIRVARLIARGMSNADVADALSISPHTARHHTERVMLKLDVRSRAEVGPRVLC